MTFPCNIGFARQKCCRLKTARLCQDNECSSTWRIQVEHLQHTARLPTIPATRLWELTRTWNLAMLSRPGTQDQPVRLVFPQVIPAISILRNTTRLPRLNWPPQMHVWHSRIGGYKGLLHVPATWYKPRHALSRLGCRKIAMELPGEGQDWRCS